MPSHIQGRILHPEILFGSKREGKCVMSQGTNYAALTLQVPNASNLEILRFGRLCAFEPSLFLQNLLKSFQSKICQAQNKTIEISTKPCPLYLGQALGSNCLNFIQAMLLDQPTNELVMHLHAPASGCPLAHTGPTICDSTRLSPYM